MTLSGYVHSQVAGLIEKVGAESERAARDTSDEGIHDLRVAIRRLSENLRVFKDLFPRGAAKAVRKDLKSAMKLAGDARNHDIARELMARARVPAAPELTAGREHAAVKLAGVLSEWNQETYARRWRELLHV